jgi:hypothetical protein
MRLTQTICAVVLAIGATASAVLAECPLDHLKVGQDAGTLILDTSQLYRHWNTDYGTNPDPFGQEYYEFEAIDPFFGGGFTRVEPGFAEITDPTFALRGIRGTDYNIVLERVFATPGLLFFDDSMQQVLTVDGATYPLSNYVDHHVHMRYVLPAGMDPTLPYTVSYRLTDSTGTYADSEVYSFNLGAAVPEPATLSLLTIGGLAVIRRQRRATGCTAVS